MPAPKPSEFNAIIPSGSSSVCDKLNLALLRMPVLMAQAIAFLFKEDGTLTDEFKALIGTATTGTGTGLAAPGGVVASDGTFANKVTVSWSAVPNATYIIYRTEGDDPATATQIATASAATYDDFTVVVGTVYTWFVKATDGSQTSGFSSGDTGFASAAGGGGAGTWSRSANTSGSSGGYVSFTVPAGITQLTSLKAWGSGAGGGGGGRPTWAPSGSTTFYPGGGGGAAEHREVTSLAVTAGETLKVYVGKKGSGGDATSDPGTNGKPTYVKRGSTNLILANGGTAGGGGGDAIAPGSGGAGGTGGSGGSSVAGGAGTSGVTDGAAGVGGVPGVSASGNAVGGAGGGNSQDGFDGTDGRVEITW